MVGTRAPCGARRRVGQLRLPIFQLPTARTAPGKVSQGGQKKRGRKTAPLWLHALTARCGARQATRRRSPVFVLRLRRDAPMAPKPISNSPQVAGSGTAPAFGLMTKF